MNPTFLLSWFFFLVWSTRRKPRFLIWAEQIFKNFRHFSRMLKFRFSSIQLFHALLMQTFDMEQISPKGSLQHHSLFKHDVFSYRWFSHWFSFQMSKVDIDTCSSNMSSIDFLYIMNKIDGNQWKILRLISKSEHVKLVLPERYSPCRGRPRPDDWLRIREQGFLYMQTEREENEKEKESKETDSWWIRIHHRHLSYWEWKWKTHAHRSSKEF
jgi:hypothetical protein